MFACPLSQEATLRNARCSGKVLVLLSLLIGLACAVFWIQAFGADRQHLAVLDPANTMAVPVRSMQQMKNGRALLRAQLDQAEAHAPSAGVEDVSGQSPPLRSVDLDETTLGKSSAAKSSAGPRPAKAPTKAAQSKGSGRIIKLFSGKEVTVTGDRPVFGREVFGKQQVGVPFKGAKKGGKLPCELSRTDEFFGKNTGPIR